MPTTSRTIETFSALILACAGAACYAPGAPENCAVSCSTSLDCPSGFVCREDDRCYESRDVPLCAGGQDGGSQVDGRPVDGEDDGGTSSIDAGQAACQVSGCNEPAFTCNTAPTSGSFGACIPDYAALPESCPAAGSIGSGRDLEAPVIWRVQLVQGDDCAPTQRGYQLTVDYFDPNGNGPRSTSSGTVMRADFGFASPLNLLASGFAITADGDSGTMINFPCVNQDPLPSAIAVRLVDDVGNRSNTACLAISP